jgi:hypothetical protein
MSLKQIETEAMRLAESGRAADEDVQRLAYLLVLLARQLEQLQQQKTQVSRAGRPRLHRLVQHRKL